jgi:hypothetical protein
MTAHTHDFPDWPFQVAVNTLTYCTVKVAREGLPVLQVTHDEDGDWQFLDATTEEPGECTLLCFGCIYQRDATLATLSDLPRGWTAFRESVGADWVREQDESEEHECDDVSREEKTLADIKAYGLAVFHILGEEDLPPFTYSVGIEQSLGLPELIVIGLKAEVGHAVINECYRQMKEGAVIAPGARVAGLLGGGFECEIGTVLPSYYEEYMGRALWLYKGENFRTYQIVFPNTAGVFPWEPEANEWFKNFQPLLSIDSAESK